MKTGKCVIKGKYEQNDSPIKLGQNVSCGVSIESVKMQIKSAQVPETDINSARGSQDAALRIEVATETAIMRLQVEISLHENSESDGNTIVCAGKMVVYKKESYMVCVVKFSLFEWWWELTVHGFGMNSRCT